MKYVTYESGARLRVGILRGNQVFDVDFNGDMVAFISAGAPVRQTIARSVTQGE